MSELADAVEDAPSGANHRLAVKRRRRPREAHARFKVFRVWVIPGRARGTDHVRAGHRIDDDSAVLDLVIDAEIVVAQANVERQIGTNPKLVEHVSRKFSHALAAYRDRAVE